MGAPPAARAQTLAPPIDRAEPSAPKPHRRLAAVSAGVAALLLLAVAGGWYVLGKRVVNPAQAAHLSVVVLPFANFSGDANQDYFADGITENLTTALSRIRDSFVIARNTAFTYKGKSVDAKAIGKELGVRYVLEGSVQRDQNLGAGQRAADRRRILAHRFGPTGSKRTWQICLSCRIKWWRN